MKARLVRGDEVVVGEGETAYLRIWEVAAPVVGSTHFYKYSLAFVCDEVCVVRFDNERGKGDHVHIDDAEVPYEFHDLNRLDDDFWRTLREWRVQNGRVQREDD
ncbi:MAG: DUF6516 family protein [Brevundimonas sp.]|uniref:toxin-antitoxin system TumE family protein n=1 Tax=Brevundimonas sp. TaxID=1871086 RepID=UPI002720C0FD|nr:DUF6516 family protein [Brevundimonas sp.]MDO9077448.1 DUF6516 family protein [Brevundimonas sp.]MDP3079727.1 DUF6516 family protein [Brevundimonas sp.]MDZ4059751.1 DUF6516 family protein [Brevundimonas sp.]